MSELAFHLQLRSIFTPSQWDEIDAEQYKRHANNAAELLLEAKRIYCNYGLYQTLELRSKHGHSPLSNSRQLASIAAKEGMHLTSLVNAITSWLDAFPYNPRKDYVNTMYVVGDASSCADPFAFSLVRSFECVLMGDINQFDMKEYARVQRETKFLYFPLAFHSLPFQSPTVNNMLQGRETTIASDGELVTIKPTKCLVRLRSLPHPDRLPTNKNQHVIINFEAPTVGLAFEAAELVGYIRRLKTHAATSNDVLECCNPYGYLCSKSSAGDMCSTCSEYHADFLSLSDDY
ncbi:ORF12 [Fowl aviadenovirus 4]|nr:ORF12 [Fowl aviadenovirus 4]